MTTTINAATSTGLSVSSDGSGIVKLQSNGVATNALAWVNYNGSAATIRSAYNVSSVTKNGGGDYTLNFTTALSDANYVVNVSAPMYTTTNGSVLARIYGSATVGSAGLQTTTQIRVCWTDITVPANFYDPAMYYVTIFGN